MRSFASILVATTFILTAAGPALAGCGTVQLVQVGTVSGEPEKDTFGLLCGTADVERTGSIATRMQGEALPIGMNTGEAEKDTVGYLQTASAQ